MKQKILSLLLVFGLSLSIPAAAAGPLPFTDVSSDLWYYTYVKDLYDAGVVDGTTPTTFSPQGDVTLGQALKLILLSAGYSEPEQSGEHWASGYYALASERGFLPSDLNLELDDAIPRVKLADIAVLVLGFQRTGTENPFADTDNNAALILYDHGIFTGLESDGKTVFRPDRGITRAEMSTVIWRIQQLRLTPSDPNTPETPEPKPDPEPDPKPDPEPDPEPDPKPEPDPEPNPPVDNRPTFQWGQYTIPIAESIPRNRYDNTLFVKDDKGLIRYESADYTSRMGIDVSRYQNNIDWAKVKEAGVEFVFIRLGYRGYGTGAIVRDAYFEQNIRGALAQGLDVGVYFFSQAITPEEGAEEARFCLENLKGYNITYPIVFDWEPYPDSYNARTKGLDDKVLTQCAVSFCETVKNAGYKPMVYANLTYFYRHFDMDQLAGYPLWLAQYNAKPSFYYHFDIWQYSSTLEIPGIDGDVDMNVQMIPKN